jgi:hypothetical protein
MRYGTAWRHGWMIALVAIAVTPAARADDAPPATAPAATPAPPGGAQPGQIGRSILVVNDVDGRLGDAAPRHIAVNDDIVFAEDITTGADAKTVIEFRDGSTFEIGPDAVIRIDSFIFNPEESTSHKTIDVSRGVFRYVSGYVASDQEAKVTTPAGAMAIRGSVVEGVVDPSIPDFVFVGEGNATFTNGSGGSNLEAGGAIAVPTASTPPMASAAMPPAVAVQAIQAIEGRLPPPAALQTRPAASEAWLTQTGARDLVPVAEQRQREAAVVARPMPIPVAAGLLAGELGLLVEANRLDLFRGGQNQRTPEQNEFLARAARSNPGAAAALQRYRVAAQAMHRASVRAGTALVIHGVGRAAPSADVMRRVTAASVHANPSAAAEINRHVAESYHGADRDELSRHGGTATPHSEEQHPATHTQNRAPPAHNGGSKPPPRKKKDDYQNQR